MITRVEVLSAVQAVPDSPWFLVAKVDAKSLSGLAFHSILILMLNRYSFCLQWSWQA